jgi:outer membrane autotransporter protein
LGMTSVEEAEFNPFYAAFSSDPAVLADILTKTNLADFRHAYDQFLPDFAGGPFETLAVGQEAIYRAQAEAPLKLQGDQTRGWVQEIGYLNHNDNTNNTGYDGSGFGVATGMETARGDGAIGVSGAFLTNRVKDVAQSDFGYLSASVLEGGVYWRSGGSGLNFNASLDGGWAWFGSKRMFLDTSSGATPLARTAEANWSGGLIAAQVGVSAPITAGRFYVRPEASVDYFALYESAHTEKHGGTAFDLAIASRTSTQATAQVDMAFGATFGDAIRWRPEVMVGWRDVVSGGPAATTASFSGGQAFTLTSNFQDKGGLLARLGLHAGGAFADFSADAGGEYRSGYQTYDARALARFLF